MMDFIGFILIWVCFVLSLALLVTMIQVIFKPKKKPAVRKKKGRKNGTKKRR